MRIRDSANGYSFLVKPGVGKKKKKKKLLTVHSQGHLLWLGSFYYKPKYAFQN